MHGSRARYASTDAASTDAMCSVCAVKIAGRKAPHAKCSCRSGITRSYNRETIRGIPDGSWTGTLSDLGCLFGHWRVHDRFVHDPFNTGLEDLEEAGIGDDLNNSNAGIIASVHADAFWSFNDALFDASDKGDLASVKLLMDARSENLAARFACSFDDT